MNIFNFSDYRLFLRNYLSERPRKGRGELKKMAEAAGVHPSLLSQVLMDTKSLSLEQTQAIAIYLDLTHLETDYFIHLVLHERAGTPKLKAYFKVKMSELKKNSQDLSRRIRQDHQLSEEMRSTFYSHWLYMAVWLYTSIQDGSSVEEVSLRFQINRERTLEILNFLVASQLCELKNGTYRMNAQSVHIGRNSPHVFKHHTHWRILSVDAIDKLEQDEIMYTAPMTISKADYQQIREQLTDFIKQLSEQVQKSKAEELVYLGLDFFRIKK